MSYGKYGDGGSSYPFSNSDSGSGSGSRGGGNPNTVMRQGGRVGSAPNNLLRSMTGAPVPVKTPGTALASSLSGTIFGLPVWIVIIGGVLIVMELKKK